MDWVQATNTGISSNPAVLGQLWYPPQDANIPFSYGIEWSAPLATSISGGGSFSTLSISREYMGATDSISTPTVLMTSTIQIASVQMEFRLADSSWLQCIYEVNNFG